MIGRTIPEEIAATPDSWTPQQARNLPHAHAATLYIIDIVNKSALSAQNQVVVSKPTAVDLAVFGQIISAAEPLLTGLNELANRFHEEMGWDDEIGNYEKLNLDGLYRAFEEFGKAHWVDVAFPSRVRFLLHKYLRDRIIFVSLVAVQQSFKTDETLRGYRGGKK